MTTTTTTTTTTTQKQEPSQKTWLPPAVRLRRGIAPTIAKNMGYRRKKHHRRKNTPYQCKKHDQPSQKTCPPTRTVAKNTRRRCKKHLPREPSQKTQELATVAKNMSYRRKKHATPWNCWSSSRWWFSNMFYVHPYLGKWSNFTKIFQMGWFNHQLVFTFFLNEFVYLSIQTESYGLWGKRMVKIPGGSSSKGEPYLAFLNGHIKPYKWPKIHGSLGLCHPHRSYLTPVITGFGPHLEMKTPHKLAKVEPAYASRKYFPIQPGANGKFIAVVHTFGWRRQFPPFLPHPCDE